MPLNIFNTSEKKDLLDLFLQYSVVRHQILSFNIILPHALSCKKNL